MTATRDNAGDAPVREDGGRELFSEQRSADVVAASFDGTADPRLRQLLTSLVRHLHAFVKDVELTTEEWDAAIAFLTATGQTCDDVRQEFVLLSDVLGISMLVETINHRTGGTSTESTVLGPFHMVESPPRELGADIALDGKGEPCLVTGQVTDPHGRPVAGALVDVWQANADGFYDVQQPDVQPERNLRGLFTTDERGPLLVPDDRAPLLPDPRRRPGRAAARSHRPAPLPARPRALPRHCVGIPSCDDPSVRRRQPVHRLRRRLRRQGQPRAGVPPRRRPGRAAEVGSADPFPHRALRRPCSARIDGARHSGPSDETVASGTSRPPCGWSSARGAVPTSRRGRRPRGLPGRWSCARPSRRTPAAQSWRALGPARPECFRRRACTCRSRLPAEPASSLPKRAPTPASPSAGGRRSAWARRSRWSTTCR